MPLYPPPLTLATLPDTDLIILGYNSLGSNLKGQTLGIRFDNITTAVAMTSGRLELRAMYLPKDKTVTGIKWFQNVTGVYTASANYNGVCLYSYSAGTLTLVANSTDDGNIWKGTAASVQSKVFTTPYSAIAGIYYIGFLYSQSAQTTAPTMGANSASLNIALQSAEFTNSTGLNLIKSSTSVLPSSILASAFSQVTQNNWMGIY